MQFETGRADYPAVRFSNPECGECLVLSNAFSVFIKIGRLFCASLWPCNAACLYQKNAAYSLVRLRCHFCTSTQDYFRIRHSALRGYLIPGNRFFIVGSSPRSSIQPRALEAKVWPLGQLFSARRWLAHYLYDGFYLGILLP